MDNIINFKEIVKNFENEEDKNFLDQLAAMLLLSEEDFMILAPGVLLGFSQSLNNANTKLVMSQAFNVLGKKAEDVVDEMNSTIKEIENSNFSRQKKDFLKEIISMAANNILETEGIAKRYLNIPIEYCHPDAKMPEYAHLTDSGMDLFALDDYVIKPGETVLIPTGIKVALPQGYELQVRPKSGRALKTKLRVANTPGTIDAGYRDEIKVIIESVEPPIKEITYEYDENQEIKITSILQGQNQYIGKGEKFAQLVLMEVPKVSFYAVDNISEIGENRNGGFGSTGLK